MRARRPSAKRMRNARCVATGDSPFFINSSTINAQCSSNHIMVYTENGIYTAVWWRDPHHCTRSPPEAMALPNRVFFLPQLVVVVFHNFRKRLLILPTYIHEASVLAIFQNTKHSLLTSSAETVILHVKMNMRNGTQRLTENAALYSINIENIPHSPTQLYI